MQLRPSDSIESDWHRLKCRGEMLIQLLKINHKMRSPRRAHGIIGVTRDISPVHHPTRYLSFNNRLASSLRSRVQSQSHRCATNTSGHFSAHIQGRNPPSQSLFVEDPREHLHHRGQLKATIYFNMPRLLLRLSAMI